MATTVATLPLDPTGTSPINRIQNEEHTMPRLPRRAIATRYGGFFAESLVVTDVATGLPVPPSSYYAAEMYLQPTTKYGKEIDSIIVIEDDAVSDNVTITYQALGGPYTTSMQAVIQMLEQLQVDGRPVSWYNLINRPADYPPSMHLHDAGDIYGFEYVVHALERIRDAIILGDSASHDTILGYIDAQITAVNAAFAQYQGNQAQLDAAQTTSINNLQAEVDRVEAAVGLQPDGQLAPFVGTNYLDATTNLRDAVVALDAVAQGNSTSIDDIMATFVKIGANEPTSLRVVGQQVQVFSNGAWRIIFPAQWAA